MTHEKRDVSPQTTPPSSTHGPTSQLTKARSTSASRLKNSLNGLVNRVKEAMSPPSENYSSERGRSPDRKDTTASTGRGGAGNMVSSESRDRAIISEAHDQQQGDRILKKYSDLPRSVGRGGAGNIRSPSRDLKKRASDDRRLKELDEEEREIEASYLDRHKFEPIHIGRGGAGNVIH